jgi:hypothetical protein
VGSLISLYLSARFANTCVANENLRAEQRRLEARRTQVFQSPKWSNAQVAEYNLLWLRNNPDSDIGDALSLIDAVGSVLYRMVLDPDFAQSVFKVLDLWKSWSDHGELGQLELVALQESREAFAYASLLISCIKHAAVTDNGILAVHIHECLNMWRVVNLG